MDKKQMIEVGLKFAGHTAIIASVAVVGAFLKHYGNENSKEWYNYGKQFFNLVKNKDY